jgi:gliding motility-associated protein GldC
MSDKKLKYNDVTVRVGLDENDLPEKIQWSATDANKESDAKATFITFWDGDLQQTLSMQLWVKDFTVDEMKQFVHQSVVLLTDTLEKATGKDSLIKDMRDFTDYFAEKSGIRPPTGDFKLEGEKKE